jgi:ribokinase
MDRRIVALCDIICANENEAEFLSGLELNGPEDAERCARRILELGPQIVIITLGAKGKQKNFIYKF